MQTVSQSFKKAIKSDTRRIYGYVDVTYQDKYYSKQVITCPNSSDIVYPDGRGLIGESKTLKKYATLENNYTLLDGSFLVWNESLVDSKGFISEDIYSDINDNTITIENEPSPGLSESYVKGVTIYFKENLPFDFTITFIDANNNEIVDVVTDNDSYTYHYMFENEIELNRVSISISSIEHPDHRIRISSIDFRVGDLYEGDELISFDISEEIDLLLESLPINTCTVKLNNYPDVHGYYKFDPINPSGFTKLLTNDAIVKPYIGVLTEENGIEYVPMGVFYINTWNSDNDGNVTFNCENILSKIKTMDIPTTGGFLSQTTTSPITTYLYNLTDIRFKFAEENARWNLLNNYNFFEWLRTFLSYTLCKKSNGVYKRTLFTVTRDNVVMQSIYDETVRDYISRDLLLSDVDYKTQSRIKTVNIKYNPDTNTPTTVSGNPPYTATHTLSTREEYAWFVMDKMILNPTLTYSVVSGDAYAQLIDHNDSMIYVKFVGEIGSVVSITYSGTTIEGYNITVDQTFENNLNNGDKITLDYTKFGLMNPSQNADALVYLYLSSDKRYKINAKTFGDPSLEAGDSVMIQTRYNESDNGYKKVIITKQNFTFDGGLTCTIEGVGD